MAEQIKSQLPGQVIIEKSVKLDSQSNGSVENAVRYLEDTMRTMLIGLKARVGWNFPMDHPVIAWLVMHVADTRTRYYMGRDGKTAYERLKGKRCQALILEFGETVLYRIPSKTLANMEPGSIEIP